MLNLFLWAPINNDQLTGKRHFFRGGQYGCTSTSSSYIVWYAREASVIPVKTSLLIALCMLGHVTWFVIR